jgi:hypothetical protein
MLLASSLLAFAALRASSNNEAAHPNAPKFMHSFDQLSNPEARP